MEKNIFLWGLAFSDMRAMFNITDDDLNKSIVEVGSGITGFNEAMRVNNREVVSVDELFRLDRVDLLALSEAKMSELELFIKSNQLLIDPINFYRHCLAGRSLFFDSYEKGKMQDRYLAHNLTSLPFNDFQFDLAIISHYLFGEREDFGLEHHVEVIMEMARVATEVRIFPLVSKDDSISALLGPLSAYLQRYEMGVEIKETKFSLQQNENAFLRIWKNACVL